MADKTYEVAVGMNVGADDQRFEPGDPIAETLVEDWMIDDGCVVIAKPKKPERAAVAATGPKASS